MVAIHCAYSEPINPPGASPVLTRAQVWKGLHRKVRRAQDFVVVIKKCDVIEDKGDEVTRDAHFDSYMGKPAMTVREVCKLYAPTKVDFIQTDGAIITNTISDGPGLTENDLHMTYTFEWRRPDIEAGSEEEKKAFEGYVKSSQGAVHSSIEAMRRMAQAGELD